MIVSAESRSQSGLVDLTVTRLKKTGTRIEGADAIAVS
jgi:hypothetical protein